MIKFELSLAVWNSAFAAFTLFCNFPGKSSTPKCRVYRPSFDQFIKVIILIWKLKRMEILIRFDKVFQ